MQEVQTFRRLGVPDTIARTVWMFGFQRRRVRTCECDTLLPKPGPLPQMSQTEATAASISRIGRVCQRLFRRRLSTSTELRRLAEHTRRQTAGANCAARLLAGGRPPPTPPRHGRASHLHCLPTGRRRQDRDAPRAVAVVKALWLLRPGVAQPAT